MLVLLVLLSVVNIAYALDVDKYGSNFNVVDDKVVVEIELVFIEETTDVLEFHLAIFFLSMQGLLLR